MKPLRNPAFLSLLLLLCLLLPGCGGTDSAAGSLSAPPAVSQAEPAASGEEGETQAQAALSLSDLPAYSGEPYVVLNDNLPGFSQEEITTTPFETFHPLDGLGRCGAAYANVCQELMPTQERESISQIHPSGWQSVQYDFIDGNSLYNRCHLIGFQLTGENANEENLITGTRYLNVTGMLPFENLVADYVQETGNHVLYRVTPLFTGDNLVADGVEMEALSVEDGGEGVCFHVFCYNVQPGVIIDYATGDSRADGGQAAPADNGEIAAGTQTQTYILNTSSHKFHLPSCSSVKSMKEENRQEYTGFREDVIAQGYSPCGQCNP